MQRYFQPSYPEPFYSTCLLRRKKDFALIDVGADVVAQEQEERTEGETFNEAQPRIDVHLRCREAD